MKDKTKSLFPYFGGKAKIAETVWDHLGVVKNYIEPFTGSGAVFFQKPYDCTSTINDFSGHIANLWRSIQRDHEAVALEASKLNGETTSKLLSNWEEIAWKQSGGYGGAKNSSKERLWISPTCKKETIKDGLF